MSHNEYFDMFKETQKKECPYKAFLIDVVNSKNAFEDPKSYIKKFIIFDYITVELLKRNCLRNDKNNQLSLLYKQISFKKEYNYSFDNILNQIQNIDDLQFYNPKKANHQFNLIINPMIIGDGCCYLTNSNTLSDEEFIQIVKNGIKKFNINYDFHFLSGKYETDSYAEGGKKLYKGYMLQILEHFSKKEGKVISHNELEMVEK